MMPILVKGGDVRSGTKAKAHHGGLWGGTGVNGLKTSYNKFIDT